MSARYSTSPALKLTLGDSQLRAVLHSAFCLITLYALWLLYDRGYLLLALPLSLIASLFLWRLRRDPMVGAELSWRQGIWALTQTGVSREIVPRGRSAVLPWLIYVAFTDPLAKRPEHLWIYHDSVSKEQLRRLRVRLTLLH